LVLFCSAVFGGKSRTTPQVTAAAIAMIAMMYRATPRRLRTFDKAEIE
jgi:F0F1-type ATP synthase assembly protein I